MKNFGEKGEWAYSETSQFFSDTPYYLRNGESYRFQIWQVHSEGPSEQKPMKNFGEKGEWAYPGTAQFFWVPPIISGTGKATDFKFGQYIQRVHPNKRPLKILEKRERGRIQRLPNFLGTPYYLRNGESYRFQIWPVHSEAPSEQKPIKNFREKEAWAYPGIAQIFGVPPIISGTGKATDFKFGQYIQKVHPNKSPLKISEKRKHGRIQG